MLLQRLVRVVEQTERELNTAHLIAQGEPVDLEESDDDVVDLDPDGFVATLRGVAMAGVARLGRGVADVRNPPPWADAVLRTVEAHL